MKISVPLIILLFGALCGTAFAQEGGVARDEQAAVRAFAERRQQMIADCEANHGSEIDCRRETDTELRAENLLRDGRVIHLRPAR